MGPHCVYVCNDVSYTGLIDGQYGDGDYNTEKEVRKMSNGLVCRDLICRYNAKKYVSVAMITVGIVVATLASAHQIVRLTVTS